MKKWFLLLTLFGFYVSSMALTPVTYSKVVQVEGASSDEIFSAIQLWISDAYMAYDSDGYFSDRSSGIITKDSRINFGNYKGFYKGWNGFLSFRLRFAVREGRFRIDINDIVHEGTKNNMGVNMSFGVLYEEDYKTSGKTGRNGKYDAKMYEEVKKDAIVRIESFLNGLLNLKINKSQDEDW